MSGSFVQTNTLAACVLLIMAVIVGSLGLFVWGKLIISSLTYNPPTSPCEITPTPPSPITDPVAELPPTKPPRAPFDAERAREEFRRAQGITPVSPRRHVPEYPKEVSPPPTSSLKKSSSSDIISSTSSSIDSTTTSIDSMMF